jgi:hypothetical protein
LKREATKVKLAWEGSKVRKAGGIWEANEVVSVAERDDDAALGPVKTLRWELV